MNFRKLILNRFSVRNYTDKPVEKEKLLQVLEAGRLAPSAANYQPWHFIVVRDKQIRTKLCEAYRSNWIQNAQLIIVACSDHSQSWKRSLDGKDSADIDVSIAVDHMTLMAADLGLGSCWICNFDVDHCSELLKLPPHVEPLALLPLGYSNSEVPSKRRKSISEIAHKDTFGVPFS